MMINIINSIVFIQITLTIVNISLLIKNWSRPNPNHLKIKQIIDGTYRNSIAGSMKTDVNKTVWIKSTVVQLPFFVFSLICLIIIGYFSKKYDIFFLIQLIIFGLWFIVNIGIELYRKNTWTLLQEIIKEKEYPNSNIVQILDLFKESNNIHILIKYDIPDKNAISHDFRKYKLTNWKYTQSVINHYNPAKMILDSIS